MTTNIVYDGTANVQEFGKADFAKEGVDHGKLTFTRGEVKAVDDAVAEVLLDGGKGVFEGFGFRKPKKGDVGYNDIDEELDGEEAKQDDAAKASKDTPAEETPVVPDNPGATLQEGVTDTGRTPTPGTTRR